MPLLRFALITTLLLSGCAATPGTMAAVPATLQGDPAHPAQGTGWLRTELYFGLGLVGGADAAQREQQWGAFLDAEVTPRFPDGLSVVEVYGQWQDQGTAAPKRLHSKLLVLLHPASAANDAAIEAIRVAWKKATGDFSVLRVTQAAAVSF